MELDINSEAYRVLWDFITQPLESTDNIFDKFRALPGALYRESNTHKQERFCYIEGTRDNKVLLVAHADTVWHNKTKGIDHNPILENGIIKSTSNNCGIGADDRAGVAILWLLRNSGHSILLVDGEENGLIGSRWLTHYNKDISNIINSEHNFFIQFDRRGSNDYKCYDVGSQQFREYVESKTGYTEPDRYSMTDICSLCVTTCGVNLSIGYYNEHSNLEILSVDEWHNTYIIVKDWLEEETEKFTIENNLTYDNDFVSEYYFSEYATS